MAERDEEFLVTGSLYFLSSDNLPSVAHSPGSGRA